MGIPGHLMTANSLLKRVGSKADDPSGSKQTILKRIKADDPGRKQTIHGSKQTIRAKADDLLSKRTIF